MITLFGATGYTGRLVARALARRQLPFRIAGRSPEKLVHLAETLASELPTAIPPAWLVADATQPDTLPSLFQDTRVLVNCAGPFTDLGEPVVAQAALSGVHYLDTTNELGYVYRMQGYDGLARQNRAAIVPSCGFEVALADCAAAVLQAGMEAHRGAAGMEIHRGAAGMETRPTSASIETRPTSAGMETRPTHGFAGPADEVSVVYALGGRGTSFGTRRSAVRALATSWLGYREGRWGWAVPGGDARRVRLPDGVRPALSFPSSETVTVPSHVAVQRVTTWMTFPWVFVLWGPILIPTVSWLARGPVGQVALDLVSRVGSPPKAGMRSDASFSIQVELRRGDVSRTLALTGKGVYDVTAEIIAYTAAQMLQPDYDQSGVLAPAVAFDPQALLERATAEWGIGVKRGP
jgi:short subunit dehydrogenase-like uncharacterized protein